MVYGYKILAAENRPESKNLGGLNDRIFQIESIKSNPKFLIKTVRKEMKKPVDKQRQEYREIISRIDYLRKLLLIYRIHHHGDIIEEVPLNIDGRAFELTSPQIFLFNSTALSSGEEEDKPALKEVMRMLSKFLQKKGELTKKTIEGVVHQALEKELFPCTTPRTVIDVNGNSIITYTISHGDIIDKVIQLIDGMPSTNPNEQAFYSTEYSRITHKRILKICRERFSGEPDTIGRGEEKERALTFDKEIVEKVGRTFEIISEIRILGPANYRFKEEEEGNDDLGEDWGIPIPNPFPSQNRPQEKGENHAQNEQVGTEERKNSNSEENRENSDKEGCLEYLAERERRVKCDINGSNSSSSENGPSSVPPSPFSCYHNGCNFSTKDESDYRRHWYQDHTGVPILYPTKFEIEKYGLKPQGKEWEI